MLTEFMAKPAARFFSREGNIWYVWTVVVWGSLTSAKVQKSWRQGGYDWHRLPPFRACPQHSPKYRQESMSLIGSVAHWARGRGKLKQVHRPEKKSSSHIHQVLFLVPWKLFLVNWQAIPCSVFRISFRRGYLLFAIISFRWAALTSLVSAPGDLEALYALTTASVVSYESIKRNDSCSTSRSQCQRYGCIRTKNKQIISKSPIHPGYRIDVFSFLIEG